MQESGNIRWKQRFSNYKKALNLLEEIMKQEQHSVIEKEGAIQRFEYTYELAWLTLKDYLTYEGILDIQGSRDAFKEAFRLGLITNGDKWIEIMKSRQLTSHSYNEDTANTVFYDVKEKFLSHFIALRTTLTTKE